MSSTWSMLETLTVSSILLPDKSLKNTTKVGSMRISKMSAMTGMKLIKATCKLAYLMLVATVFLFTEDINAAGTTVLAGGIGYYILFE